MEDLYPKTFFQVPKYHLLLLDWKKTFSLLTPPLWFNSNHDPTKRILIQGYSKKTRFSVYLRSAFLTLGGSLSLPLAWAELMKSFIEAECVAKWLVGQSFHFFCLLIIMKTRTISFLKATTLKRKLGKLEDDGFPECGGTEKGMSKQVVSSMPVLCQLVMKGLKKGFGKAMVYNDIQHDCLETEFFYSHFGCPSLDLG